MLNIAEVIKYKVRDGDTLKSIADSHGMTWQELAKFNFGTSDEKEVNKFLRSQVGSFRKKKDKKTYILSSRDNPGVIYIPKELKKRTFGPNTTHRVAIELLKPKKFIPSKTMVWFRPKPDWKGEYGFDWLRVKNDPLVTEPDYESIINGGYNGVADSTGHTKVQAYAALKNEYRHIKTGIASDPDYFAPYLNLFPKGADDIGKAPYEAELRIGVAVEGEEPLTVELEYDTNLFQIDKFFLNDKGIGVKRASGDGTLKITCIHEFDETQEIKVLAFPPTYQADEPVPVAGKIVVVPNHEIKHLRFVLVRVRTKIKKRERVGSFGDAEKINLQNTLYQALVVPHLDNYKKERGLLTMIIDWLFSIDAHCIDLSEDPNFKITDSGRGKFVHPTKPQLNQNYKAPGSKNNELFFYLKDLFFKTDGNEKYKDHFPVFAFDETADRNTIGQIQSIDGVFQKNLLLFGDRDETTLNHEVCHGLKLRHTHKEGADDAERASFVPKPEARFTFDKEKTDNVMSYVNNALTTWHWQWEILRKSI